MAEGLGLLQISRKSGSEPFHHDDQQVGFDLLDFWRWSGSDLIGNTARGVLTEYIVAKAVGIPTSGVRDGWAPYDLQSPDGIKIEVKSAAFVQSWSQKKLSAIQFVVACRRGFDPEANVLEEVASRHADVYVFALLAHRDKATIDPLDLSQWRFYVLPTRVLNKRTRSQHSITLSSLQALAGPALNFWNLGKAVREAAARGRAADV